jgi:PAS domain S-box-containing protein
VTEPNEPEGLNAALLDESPEELYEQAPCGYVSTFPDGTFIRVNQTFLDWTGYARNDLLGVRRFQDLLTVGGRIFYETHIAPLLHMQGSVNEIALDLVSRGGQRLPILINSIQKCDVTGAPLLYRTTIFNASERRKYEQELLLARKQAEQAADRIARLQTVMVALAEALSATRVAEIITEQGIAAFNAQAGLIAVVTDDGASLELVHAVGYPADLLENWQHFPLHSSMPLTDAVRTGEPVVLESPEALAIHYPHIATLLEHTGNLSMAAIPLGLDGRAIGVLGLSFASVQTFTSEDRTFLLTLARQCGLALERARLYEAERSARTEAQEALRIRDAFLSIAAHELKNPLTSLLGNAQLLQRRTTHGGIQPERDQHTIAVIVDQASRLNKLITALLDVSRMETDQLSIVRAALDLCALARRIVEDVQPTLTQHTLNFSDPGRALIISGDALRLEQVIQNLLQNAIKYSPAGGLITVQVEQREQMACVAVTDQGIGIPQEALPRLFQRFYRAEPAESGTISGLGIGLYVVKEIVTLHGGTVTVESTQGRGSTFTVYLPLAHTTESNSTSTTS